MTLSNSYIDKSQLAKFTATSDRPSTKFEQARDDQNAALNALDALVTSLAARLNPVLGPLYEEDSSENNEDGAEAALVAVMRNHTHRIQGTNARIDGLLSRLCI